MPLFNRPCLLDTEIQNLELTKTSLRQFFHPKVRSKSAKLFFCLIHSSNRPFRNHLTMAFNEAHPLKSLNPLEFQAVQRSIFLTKPLSLPRASLTKRDLNMKIIIFQFRTGLRTKLRLKT